MLTANQGEILLKIARENIKSYLIEGSKAVRKGEDGAAWLDMPAAVFVTLQIDGNLRGCIGSLEASRSLYQDLISHSYNAAFADPRFPPLAQEELESVKVEVSVLSKREVVDYVDFDDLKTKIEPYQDGIYLTQGLQAATFLPQVWEQLPDFDEFFRHLCLKAGLSPDEMLKEHPKIEKYSVQKFEEE